MSTKKPVSQNTTLTMNRGGEFSLYASGPHHCGILNDLKVKYNMVCECETKLDSRGFLFDQVNVDNFFKDIIASELSCEELCIDCAKKLQLLIAKENPGCVIRRMSLTLSPQPFLASMTFDWQAKQKSTHKPFINF